MDMDKPLCNSIDQVGVVVCDIDKSIKDFEKIFGKNIFEIIEGEPVRIFEDGREVKIKAKAAFANLGNIQLELIEIIKGPAIHTQWLEKRGEGIHHVGVYVSDFDKSLKEFTDAGIKILHLGRGRMRYAYMDTKPFCIEIIEKKN
jgi:methylmalonyl-CoA/ethylmalonyl-CoA epimerase